MTIKFSRQNGADSRARFFQYYSSQSVESK